MKLLIQIGFIFGVCWVSQLIERILPFTFPASVIGMVLVLLLLVVKAIKVDHIRELSDYLLGNLGFFFVPVSAGLINYVDVIRENLVPFFTIVIVSTILTYGATAGTVALTRRLMNRGKEQNNV